MIDPVGDATSSAFFFFFFFYSFFGLRWSTTRLRHRGNVRQAEFSVFVPLDTSYGASGVSSEAPQGDISVEEVVHRLLKDAPEVSVSPPGALPHLHVESRVAKQILVPSAATLILRGRVGSYDEFDGRFVTTDAHAGISQSDNSGSSGSDQRRTLDLSLAVPVVGIVIHRSNESANGFVEIVCALGDSKSGSANIGDALCLIHALTEKSSTVWLDLTRKPQEAGQSGKAQGRSSTTMDEEVYTNLHRLFKGLGLSGGSGRPERLYYLAGLNRVDYSPEQLGDEFSGFGSAGGPTSGNESPNLQGSSADDLGALLPTVLVAPATTNHLGARATQRLRVADFLDHASVACGEVSIVCAGPSVVVWSPEKAQDQSVWPVHKIARQVFLLHLAQYDKLSGLSATLAAFPRFSPEEQARRLGRAVDTLADQAGSDDPLEKEIEGVANNLKHTAAVLGEIALDASRFMARQYFARISSDPFVQRLYTTLREVSGVTSQFDEVKQELEWLEKNVESQARHYGTLVDSLRIRRENQKEKRRQSHESVLQNTLEDIGAFVTAFSFAFGLVQILGGKTPLDGRGPFPKDETWVNALLIAGVLGVFGFFGYKFVRRQKPR